MHIYQLDRWQHHHRFECIDHTKERKTRIVILITLVMMAVEIAAGMMYGSMALLADGWHMGTHAVALGITAFAYYYAEKHKDNPQYTFGTGKVGVLGGFASAVVLAVIALIMGVESIQRLISPVSIRFDEAILVAFIGLLINTVSAFILQEKEPHDHSHHHHDHNLKAAYMHVIADALTSFLAIIALMAGKIWGWNWMDPIMGMIGGVIILKWAKGLLVDTSRILLDRDTNSTISQEIRKIIESDADNRVTDLHVWRVGSHHLAAIISIVTHYPKTSEYYKNLLSQFDEIVHVTIEVMICEDEPCIKKMF